MNIDGRLDKIINTYENILLYIKSRNLMGDSYPFNQGGEDMITKYNVIVMMWITLCFLGTTLLPMCHDFPNAKGVPVIIEEEHAGSWTDIFNDTLGVESFDNLTIDTKNVRFANQPYEIGWTHEYPADLEPEDYGWTCVNNSVGDLASASGGILLLDTTPESAYWWYDLTWGASNSLGATFEAKLKIESSNGGIRVILYDGKYYTGMILYSDRIGILDSSTGYYMDTTDSFHTYRFTVQNNDYMIYVDGILRIDGTNQHNAGTAGNHCLWGDTDNVASYSGRAEWDYVRYNISGAFPPTSSSYFENGNLTSTEIFLPNEMSWDRISINKTEPGSSNFINVSVLDGVTFTVIPGFNNLESTDIDISSIDPITYPSIRLHATFSGNVTSTPVLHDWEVTWFDALSPATPKGLAVSNPLNGFSLILSWNSNSEHDLDHYIIYYSQDNSTFIWLANFSADTMSFTHYGLSLGNTYYYKIAAVDSIPNQSPFSDVVLGIPDLDYDNDGIGNIVDLDDDNDGIADIDDPYPYSAINDMELTLDNLTIDLETLRTWLDTVIINVESNINATNETLHLQLALQNDMMTNFHNSLMINVGYIQSDLQTHDLSSGQNHSDIIALLDDVLEGQIEREKITELRTMLIDLADNISVHNQSMADDIMEVVEDIDEFEVENHAQLDRINKTLEDLSMLEQILGDLQALNQSLDQAEEDIQDSIDDRSTKEEDEDRFFVLEMLLIIVFILLIIIILLTIFTRKQRMAENPSKTHLPYFDEQPKEPIPPPPPTEKGPNNE
jgi:hypothetical protein